MQDLEDHTNQELPSRTIISLINTILSKSSTYTKFAELFVKPIPNVYGRVDIMADCYKTKSIKSSEQLSIKRGQSEKIHRASLLSKVPSDFYNSILRTDAIWNGMVISVPFIEKERQYALKYSRAVPNSKARLQHLEMN